MWDVVTWMEWKGKWHPISRKSYRWRWLAMLCNPRPYFVERDGLAVWVEFKARTT